MAAAWCKTQNLQRSCRCSSNQFLQNKLKIFSTFLQTQFQAMKAPPKWSNKTDFLLKSTRRGWRWWRWWRRWWWRGGSMGFFSSQFREPCQWWWCQFLLFLLSASCADWPLGWFKLPCHLLCCWRLLYRCRWLHLRSDRLSCRGPGLCRCYASGNPGNLPCFAIVVSVLFREQLTKHFGFCGFSEQVPARFSRQPLGPCYAFRFVTSSRDPGGTTGIGVRQVWVPVTVPCHRATTKYWQINRARSWTLRIRVSEKKHNKQNLSKVLLYYWKRLIIISLPEYYTQK